MKNKTVILLSEDDEGHAKLITSNIKRIGIKHEIVVFRNGQETLDFFYQKGVGPHREKGVSYVLLLDLNMPLVNGFEVLKQLKQDSKLKNIPVVVLSVSDDPEQIHRCYDIGCSKYVIKPVDHISFSNAIRNLGRYIHRDVMPQLGYDFSH